MATALIVLKEKICGEQVYQWLLNMMAQQKLHIHQQYVYEYQLLEAKLWNELLISQPTCVAS